MISVPLVTGGKRRPESVSKKEVEERRKREVEKRRAESAADAFKSTREHRKKPTESNPGFWKDLWNSMKSAGLGGWLVIIFLNYIAFLIWSYFRTKDAGLSNAEKTRRKRHFKIVALIYMIWFIIIITLEILKTNYPWWFYEDYHILESEPDSLPESGS